MRWVEEEAWTVRVCLCRSLLVSLSLCAVFLFIGTFISFSLCYIFSSSGCMARSGYRESLPGWLGDGGRGVGDVWRLSALEEFCTTT